MFWTCARRSPDAQAKSVDRMVSNVVKRVDCMVFNVVKSIGNKRVWTLEKIIKRDFI